MSTEISISTTVGDTEPGPVPGLEVTFLPLAVEDGIGVYGPATEALIAELAESGVRAGTVHASGEVEFVDDRSLLTQIPLELAVGIASSAGWQALLTLLRRRNRKQVVVSVVVQTATERRRVQASGDADGVAAALAELAPYRS